MLVVILLIGILAVIGFPNIQALQAKAEGVVCTARLRSLWMAFSTTLHDGNGWPQLPSAILIGSTDEQQWWLNYSSNNLGLTARDWNCPTIARAMLSSTNTNQVTLISYLPTLFDAKPLTPTKWARMPWFTEIQSVHGAGNLSVRTDGSVCPIQDP
jgi:hypothetical protein